MSLVTSVLTKAGVYFRNHSTKANEIVLNCPFCSERGKTEDEHQKLGINTAKFLGNCYRCHFRVRGLRSLLTQLCRVYNVPFPKLTYQAPMEEDDTPPPAPDVALPTVEATGFPEGYETFTFSGRDEVEQQALLYLESRKVTPIQIMQHRIGFAAWGNYSYRVVFPVIGGDDQVYGYACRAFADQEPRYLNSPGIKLLWGAHRSGKVAIECEGIMDGLAVERAVLNMKGVVPVAPLGSATTDLQLKQLEQYESTVLFPDRDLAGVQGCVKRAKQYTRHGLKVYVIIPTRLDKQDPGSLTPEKIRAELDRAVPWTDALEYRLRILREDDDL